MVDLTDLPDMKASPQVDAKVKRFGEKRRRVIREMAPKGEMARDKTAALPRLRPRLLHRRCRGLRDDRILCRENT